VSGEGGESENPYRFTGGASESNASTPAERRRLTSIDLRRISRGRRYLAALLGLFAASCLATMTAVALTPASYAPPREAATYIEFAIGSMVVVWIAMIGLFVVGSKMIRLLGRPFAALEALALVFPATNVVVATLLIFDARRTLVSRNVRLGWLKDDLSEADADRSFWRSSAL
jgi:hypothetical protein